MFEIGKTYEQRFSNGDVIFFTVRERCKNGSWRGFAVEVPIGRKPRKAKQITVFHPPVAEWKESRPLPTFREAMGFGR